MGWHVAACSYPSCRAPSPAGVAKRYELLGGADVTKIGGGGWRSGSASWRQA